MRVASWATGARAAGAALALTAASCGLYLLRAQLTDGLGLPLDDAWIHQTYARNLVERGEWAFQAGEPSAGSTSPLWSALLAVGRVLSVDPLAWAFLLGGVMLWLNAYLVTRWVRSRLPSRAHWAGMIGLLVLLEWHLVWAGLSGMEILASALVAIGVLYAADQHRLSPFWLGGFIGIGVWLRPEAILLLVPVAWIMAWRHARMPAELMKKLSGVALGLLVPVLAYGLFNRALSGSWLPTTWYAKSAEYAVLRQVPLLVRFAAQVGIPAQFLGYPELASGGPLVGPLVLLLPAFVIGAWRAVGRAGPAQLAPLLWVVLHLSAYALRLPPTYQHGRYAMPVIPVVLALAGEGLLDWCRPQARQMSRRVLSRAWLLSTPLVAVFFWVGGAGAYATDVAVIQSEMVATAHWIERHTERNALVAAHDIGALGYFGDRQLVDLAGLVSPEVIGFLRDEDALAGFLDRRQADYLVSFPSWYPSLTSGLEVVYRSSGRFSPAAGGENMLVYRWPGARFAP